MLDNCNKNFVKAKFHKGIYVTFSTEEVDRWCLQGGEWVAAFEFFGKLSKLSENSTTVFRILFYFIFLSETDIDTLKNY